MWFNCTLLLKKILSAYLDYTAMHSISSGSNVFHDDNAPLHKAQVVTECHHNAVSHTPIRLLQIDIIRLSFLYLDAIQTVPTYIQYLCISGQLSVTAGVHIRPDDENELTCKVSCDITVP